MVRSLFKLAGDVPELSPEARLRAFRFLILVHTTIQTFALLARSSAPFPPIALMAAGCFLTLCCALCLSSRYGRLACALAVPIVLWQVYGSFPLTANHRLLELVCVLLVALHDLERDDDGRLLLQSLRWVTVIVLFYTGLQKVMLGYYFRGEFLAFMLGPGRFADLFAWIVPAEEIVRLQSYDHFTEGAGPFRVDWLPFLVVANSVYVAEMVLPVLLMVRRTRAVAAGATIAFVACIEAGARELMFGLLLLQLLLLFYRSDWNRRLLPVSALMYLFLLATVFELVSAPAFLRRGSL